MKSTSVILFSAFIASLLTFAVGIKVVPENYDSAVVPNSGSGKPVNVKAEIAVLNIRSIKEADLTYTLDIFLNLYWSDTRLNGPDTSMEDGLILDSSWKSKIWKPSINFKNSVTNRLITSLEPLVHMTIYNKTNVRLSARLSLDLLCEMNFKYYPHDTQTCFLDVMSFTYNNKSVTLQWEKFMLTKNLYMTGFYVHHSEERRCDKTFKGLGTINCLRGVVVLKRFVGNFVIMKYVPSTIIVMMCFVGFWIPANAYPARVALSITSLLALITQQMQASALNVSYIMALNVWSLICITFVFFTLVELALSVLWAHRHEYMEKRIKYRKVSQGGTAIEEAKTLEVPKMAAPEEEGKISLWRFLIIKLQTNLLTHSTNKIDSVARVMFPVLFILSAILYFVLATSE
ncbi:Glycine receptor subunit alphaZ1 [Halotydeus destructor]|nr:Glycine receptor subunit alphaZ1 [Halotydeus destructor]